MGNLENLYLSERFDFPVLLMVTRQGSHGRAYDWVLACDLTPPIITLGEVIYGASDGPHPVYHTVYPGLLRKAAVTLLREMEAQGECPELVFVRTMEQWEMHAHLSLIEAERPFLRSFVGGMLADVVHVAGIFVAFARSTPLELGNNFVAQIRRAGYCQFQVGKDEISFVWNMRIPMEHIEIVED